MKHTTISLDNYDNIISKIPIKELPEILQKGHLFFLEAKDFYTQEPEIKETIDIYLEQLNTYLYNHTTPMKNTSSVSMIKTFLDMHRTVLSKGELKEFIFSLQKAITRTSKEQ